MTHEHRQQYTCPMHPEVIKDAPGSCPKYGMNLVPVTQETKREHSRIMATMVNRRIQGWRICLCTSIKKNLVGTLITPV